MAIAMQREARVDERPRHTHHVRERIISPQCVFRDSLRPHLTTAHAFTLSAPFPAQSVKPKSRQ
jgi:hypothetical protein